MTTHPRPIYPVTTDKRTGMTFDALYLVASWVLLIIVGAAIGMLIGHHNG